MSDHTSKRAAQHVAESESLCPWLLAGPQGWKPRGGHRTDIELPGYNYGYYGPSSRKAIA